MLKYASHAAMQQYRMHTSRQHGARLQLASQVLADVPFLLSEIYAQAPVVQNEETTIPLVHL